MVGSHRWLFCSDSREPRFASSVLRSPSRNGQVRLYWVSATRHAAWGEQHNLQGNETDEKEESPVVASLCVASLSTKVVERRSSSHSQSHHMLADDRRPVNGRVITEARIGTSKRRTETQNPLVQFIRLDEHAHDAENSRSPHGPTCRGCVWGAQRLAAG